jgi:hypothetical protein
MTKMDLQGHMFFDKAKMDGWGVTWETNDNFA